MFLYIGPGVSLATVLIIVIILLIVFVSIAVVLWRPIKRFFSRLKSLFNGK